MLRDHTLPGRTRQEAVHTETPSQPWADSAPHLSKLRPHRGPTAHPTVTVATRDVLLVPKEEPSARRPPAGACPPCRLGKDRVLGAAPAVGGHPLICSRWSPGRGVQLGTPSHLI